MASPDIQAILSSESCHDCASGSMPPAMLAQLSPLAATDSGLPATSLNQSLMGLRWSRAQPIPAARRDPSGSAAVAAASSTVETPESAASTQLPEQSALIVVDPLSRMPAPERMLRSDGEAA
ncbi:hypothetical protein N798_17125 [Knoellia flava TL1]|uniref:Uncharacterized protein n=2 Tax=Knoellia flava TaxID=913969 RepID=A0A8H9KRX7_9MICO|nr:hypothetical protein N798_17125 [Knoellia flava TL1]GGB85360.1 hypothetical protein GCM10011314_26330 [Knoellia flava]